MMKCTNNGPIKIKNVSFKSIKEVLMDKISFASKEEHRLVNNTRGYGRQSFSHTPSIAAQMREVHYEPQTRRLLPEEQ